MTRKEKRPSTSIGIKLCIWSVQNQSWLAGQVRIYLYAGTALIAFLALAGVISIETAMFSAFSVGIITMGVIWTLVQHRKTMLLNIREPELRNRAHQAMLAYLNEVDPETYAPMRVERSAARHGEGCPDRTLH